MAHANVPALCMMAKDGEHQKELDHRHGALSDAALEGRVRKEKPREPNTP